MKNYNIGVDVAIEMTNEQILKQVMEKAEKNGWKNPHELSIGEFNLYRKYFSHDFAEAFWGEENRRVELKDELGTTMIMLLKTHEYHLMQMVREKDPLQYLKKFL